MNTQISLDGVFIIVDFLCALRHLQHHAPLLKRNNRPTIDDRGGFFRWGAPAAILGDCARRLAKNLDVAHRIAVNIVICTRQVLEIDFPS